MSASGGVKTGFMPSENDEVYRRGTIRVPLGSSSIGDGFNSKSGINSSTRAVAEA